MQKILEEKITVNSTQTKEYIQRCNFIPAVLTGIENVAKRCLLPKYDIDGKIQNRFGLYKGNGQVAWDGTGYDPTFWTDRAIFTHPNMLISFHYAQKYKNYRKELRVRDETSIWADSGGYSIATQGVQITPIDALKWQEQNSDIAFSLDIPPAILTGVGRVSPGKHERLTGAAFEKNAEMSRQNNLIFRENRTSDKLKIFNVIHGYNIETMNLWYDYVASDIKFEGYATGTKPAGDMLLQAVCIMHLWSKGIRERVHLLGVSGITVIPVLVWASQYIDKISFDSTSYGYGARTRAYVYPDRIRDYTHFGKKYLTKKHPIKELNCECPICSDLQTVDYFCANDTTWPGCLLSLHNLWHVKRYVELLDRTLHVDRDKERFMELVKQHTGASANKAIHAINFIEACVSMGFKKAYDVYFSDHPFAKQKFKARQLV